MYRPAVWVRALLLLGAIIGTAVPATAQTVTTTIARQMGEGGAVANTFLLDITFSESVIGFEMDDVTVTGGRVLELSTGNTAAEYTVRIRPTVDGTVTVNIPMAAATGMDTAQENQAATFTVTADLPHTVALTETAAVATEGVSSGVTVTLALTAEPGTSVGTVQVPIQLNYLGDTSTADISPLPDESADVTAIVGRSDRVQADVSDGSANVIVVALNDLFWEPGEGLELQLDDAHAEWPNGVRLGANNSTVVSFTESKLPPRVTLHVAPAALAEVGGVSSTALTASIEDTGVRGRFVSSFRLELSYAGSAVSELTAPPGVAHDYEIIGRSISLPTGGGDPIDTITLRVRNDGVAESQTERVLISARVFGNDNLPTNGITVMPVQVTIVDQLVASIAAATESVGEPVAGETATAHYTISLNATPAETLVAAADASHSAYPAMPGQDFTLSQTTTGMQFSANTAILTQTLTVTVQPDDIVEGTEDISIGLVKGTSFPPAAAIDSTPATVLLTDDDEVEVSITAAETIVAEHSPMNFAVRVSAPIEVFVAVPWQVELAHGVTAADFITDSPISGTVMFQPGDTPATPRAISLATRQDGDYAEGDENVTVVLAAPHSILQDRAMLTTNQDRASTLLGSRPSAPATVAAYGGWKEMFIKWMAPIDADIRPVTGYRVEVLSTDEEATWVPLVSDLDPTETSYWHTGLTPRQSASYRVFATNALGQGEAGTAVGRVLAMPDPGMLDVNRDGAVTAEDAAAVYYVAELGPEMGVGVRIPNRQHHARRHMYLGPYLAEGEATTNANITALIRSCRQLLDVGMELGLDVNLSGHVDASDAYIMYFTLAHPDEMGDGVDATKGSARVRFGTLHPRIGDTIYPHDRNLLGVIRWVRRLQP